MMAIVVSACLLSDPARCELHSLGMFAGEGFKACHLSMIPAVQSWALSHPDLAVQSAYCMPARQSFAP